MDKALKATIVNIRLKGGTTMDAKTQARHLVDAHSSAQSKTHFWSYETTTGTGNRYVIIAPFNKYADLERPTTAEVHSKALKANKAAASATVITDLESMMESQHRTMFEYIPGLSNHPTNAGDAPGPYLYRVTLQIKPSDTDKARQAAEKILAAHKKSQKGLKFWTYGATAGVTGEYQVFIPFSKHSELDGWASTADICSDAYGAQESSKLLSEMESYLVRSKRAILRYVPDLSHPPV